MSLLGRLRGAPADDSPTAASGIVEDSGDAFDVLANARRRCVLRCLDTDGPTPLGELAEQIAAVEQDTRPDAVRGADRQRVYIALKQSHIDMMVGCGVVEHDRDRTVRPGPRFAAVTQALYGAERALADNAEVEA